MRLGAQGPLATPGGVPSLPPILCYHKVDRRHELGVTRLSPRRFARQLERLAEDGWRTLSLRDLTACARGERRAGTHELGITFDDGYRALRDHAFPVVAALGFTAVCFVVTDYAGRLNRWDVAYGGRRFAHLSWRDVERWAQRGIEFGSHTATHPRLTWLDERQARAELTRSRRALAEVLGDPADALSYPFGAAAARERSLAVEAGYRVAFALARGRAGDPMAVPRLPVYVWSPPRPGVGTLARVERWAAIAANRCAVGTSAWRRLTVGA